MPRSTRADRRHERRPRQAADSRRPHPRTGLAFASEGLRAGRLARSRFWPDPRDLLAARCRGVCPPKTGSSRVRSATDEFRCSEPVGWPHHSSPVAAPILLVSERARRFHPSHSGPLPSQSAQRGGIRVGVEEERVRRAQDRLPVSVILVVSMTAAGIVYPVTDSALHHTSPIMIAALRALVEL